MTQSTLAKKQRVFSGVQPTGALHIGNYIGAISQWVANQDDFENIFCVVDLHAITIPEAIQAKVLRERCLDVAAMYMACGIDPAKSTVFIQSQVKQHAELAWILNCVTPMGWMRRMTQFKSKGDNVETVGVGLFDYPVLQAADILLYQTHFVPVGEDQRQHIEITQDIAQRFGHLFKDVFTQPQMMSLKHGAKIMGLDDPTAKMSKSATSKRHAVFLMDTPAQITKKIKSAETDSGREMDPENLSAGLENLMTIYHAFSGESYDAAVARFTGQGYGTIKSAVAEAVVDGLAPIQARFNELRSEETELRAILDASAERAAMLAERTMVKVRKAVGLH